MKVSGDRMLSDMTVGVRGGCWAFLTMAIRMKKRAQRDNRRRVRKRSCMQISGPDAGTMQPDVVSSHRDLHHSNIPSHSIYYVFLIHSYAAADGCQQGKENDRRILKASSIHQPHGTAT